MNKLKPPYSDIVFASDYEWLNHYDRKFKARRAVMLHAINQGWSLNECRLVFLNERYPGAVLWLLGEDDRELGRIEAIKRFTEDYDACYAKYRENSSYTARDIRQMLSMLKVQVESARWPGRTGKTDRDVLLYVLSKGIQIGCDKIDCSSREAALGAGVAQPTASAALSRLCKSGYLERTNYHRSFTRANGYKVCQNLSHNLFYGENNVIRDDTPPVTHIDTSHECWLHLGKSAAEIYRYLSDNPLSARAIAKLAEMGNKTASRNLPKLEKHGLAKQTDNGWIIGDLTPDEAADVFWPDDSRTEKRKAQFAREREIRGRAQEQICIQAERETNEPTFYGATYKAWPDDPDDVNPLSEVAAVESDPWASDDPPVTSERSELPIRTDLPAAEVTQAPELPAQVPIDSSQSHGDGLGDADRWAGLDSSDSGDLTALAAKIPSQRDTSWMDVLLPHYLPTEVSHVFLG